MHVILVMCSSVKRHAVLPVTFVYSCQIPNGPPSGGLRVSCRCHSSQKSTKEMLKSHPSIAHRLTSPLLLMISEGIVTWNGAHQSVLDRADSLRKFLRVTEVLVTVKSCLPHSLLAD